MSKLIVFGDDHVRFEEPYFSAKKDYFDWVAKQEWNNEENYAVHVGDFFHRRSPSPKEYQLAHRFFNSLNFKRIYVLAGNGVHEINRVKETYAVDPLEEHSNVEIVRTPQMADIDKIKIALLPAIPPGFYGGKSQQEYYEEWVEGHKEIEFNYIFGHFFHKEMFGDKVDIDALSGIRRMGHYHIPNLSEGYVGVNTITRSDEKGITCTLNLIDTETGEEEVQEIPKFIDFYEVDYNKATTGNVKPLDRQDCPYPIYNVYNAPDLPSIKHKYGEIYINQWFKPNEETEDKEVGVVVGEKEDLASYLEKFFTVKKINNPTIQDKIKELIL